MARLARVVGLASGVALALVVGGCGTLPPAVGGGGDDNTTDQMYNTPVTGAEFYVFPYEDKVFTVKDPNTIDLPVWDPLEDGKFYKVVADVRWLNGGVAGYVNYPQIESLHSYEEVSPYDMGLPSIRDKRYGLTLIGDYADGDLFFYDWNVRALWKDGSWLWRYDRELDLGNGSVACCKEGVTADEVRSGMDAGVLACERYFVLPPA